MVVHKHVTRPRIEAIKVVRKTETHGTHFQTGALLLLIAACRRDADPATSPSLQRRPGCGRNHSRDLAVRAEGQSYQRPHLHALLPPLLFEAAFYIHWEQLRRDFPVIVVLATLGVLLSACVTATGMHYLAHWQWLGALVFGVLIAATDPVSVIATFKEAKAHGSFAGAHRGRESS